MAPCWRACWVRLLALNVLWLTFTADMRPLSTAYVLGRCWRRALVRLPHTALPGAALAAAEAAQMVTQLHVIELEHAARLLLRYSRG